MQLTRHPLGFYEIQPKPNAEQLHEHYRSKYYDNTRRVSQYSHTYTDEELLHKEIAPAESFRMVSSQPKGSLFEIGYGEGFFLQYFVDKEWDVSGIDFSDEGLMKYHPSLRSKVQTGDVYDHLEKIVASKNEFDLVVCNNVLEHVIDPIQLATQLKNILSPEGLCRIAVPNDGSWLQELVIEKGYAKSEYWVNPPEHLSYFSIPSLRRLLENTGWEVVDILAEFPVDLFLLNPESNYQQDGAKGRSSHFARISFETNLYQRSLDELIEFRRGCSRAGIGRNIVAYAKRK